MYLQITPEIEIIEETETELEPLYRVIIHNDDVTPMDFVVHILTSIFYLGTDTAAEVMLKAHISGMAYVRFAVDQPALFRLVFSAACQGDPLDAQPAQASAALRGLREHIEALLPQDSPVAERKAAALHAWALVHGIAQLVLDRQIPADWPLIERVLMRVSLR